MKFEAENQLLASLKNSSMDLLGDYISHLHNRYDVNINLHDIAGVRMIDERLSDILTPYLYHNNLFCNYLKKFKDTFQACVSNKDILCRRFSRNPEVFYGACYMGVEEIRFPVHWNNRVIAFLCVGQFCSDEEAAVKRLEDKAAKYGLNPQELIQRYKMTTKPLDVNITELHTQIGMLAGLMVTMYEKFLLTNNKDQAIEHVAESHKKNYILDQTIHYIKANYKEPISLKSLAASSYCSDSYLSFLFKEKMGLTLTEYIHKFRIGKAQQLLDVTSLTITEIAYQCGFGDSNYFARVFRQQTGMSPRQYRERTI